MSSYQTTNTRCLIEAAKRLGFSFEIFDKNGNLILIKAGGKNLFFANYSTPFNSDSFCKIAKDKEFTHFILKNIVKMPVTAGFFDPNYDEGGEIKSEANSYEKILKEIFEKFAFPVMVKPNSLSRGRNCFVCGGLDEVKAALQKIFEKNQNYDYMALVQEYIKARNEYRAVVFKNKIVLVYSREKQITDEAILKEIAEFLKPVFNVLEIGFAGLDVIFGENGNKYLIEINSQPGFRYFVEQNGKEEIVKMYEKIFDKETRL